MRASAPRPKSWSARSGLKAERCDEILKDTASGNSLAGRPQLRKALDSLAPGDELVIAEWDRATRSMWDGLQILKEIIDAGATIRVLDRDYIDLTSPIGRGFMAFISAMAEAANASSTSSSGRQSSSRIARASSRDSSTRRARISSRSLLTAEMPTIPHSVGGAEL